MTRAGFQVDIGPGLSADEFAECERRAAALSNTELHGAIADLEATIRVCERSVRDGFPVRKLGAYCDTLLTYCAERTRRQTS